MNTFKIFINHLVRSIPERRHNGEAIGFCQSENLEQSREKAKRLKASPSIYSKRIHRNTHVIKI